MPYNSIRRPERARQNQTLHHAAVAHLVERHLAKVEVASSSLVGRSISEIWFQAAGLHLVQALQANQVGSFLCGPVVQLVRTLACHARGRQFEPDPGRHYASVAQSVEQGTENPRVIGSIPIGGTSFLYVLRKEYTVCGRSSSGRAPPCQGGGSEFEPRRPLQTNSKEPVYAGFLLIMVTWPSGKARVCKTLIRQFKSARHLHKTVMKKMSQSFFFVVASKIGDFANRFLDTVLQCCPTIFGRFSHPDAHYFCRFLEFGRGGDDFLRKNRIISAAFRRFSISPQPISEVTPKS